MRKSESGSSLLGILIAVSFSIGSIIFVLTFTKSLHHYRDGLEISRDIIEIKDAASHSYKNSVMFSRCLSAPAMNIQRLIKESRISSEINKNGIVKFDVSFHNMPLNTWSRPSQILINATFNQAAELADLKEYLPAAKQSGNTLTFAYPLSVNTLDSDFNKTTGCLQ